MIHSMTAFAREQSQGPWGTLTCEMRSINHRYLEVSLHLSEALRPFEGMIREKIRKMVKRGKIECSLRYRPGVDSDTAFVVNAQLVNQLVTACEEIRGSLKNPAPIPASDILRFPGVLETKETDQGTLQSEVMSLVEHTLKDLLAAREREGAELNKLFLERMDRMQTEMENVRTRLPQVMKDAQERLLKRFTDAKIELDPARVEQEMVMFAQKIDIAEEIERTETHIAEVRRVLKNGGAAGRRLDFLLQELNREANTMGSKSTDTIITHAAVEMKVLIEQVREQVQNIE
ncbi:MAG TPA: YicC/YloC family endoribonuclease [Gammaproteobacteria bacterium]|nr:YicC/YloC family endoribonuclease [Gammaproteobacteria bacterium]